MTSIICLRDADVARLVCDYQKMIAIDWPEVSTELSTDHSLMTPKPQTHARSVTGRKVQFEAHIDSIQATRNRMAKSLFWDS